MKNLPSIFSGTIGKKWMWNFCCPFSLTVPVVGLTLKDLQLLRSTLNRNGTLPAPINCGLKFCTSVEQVNVLVDGRVVGNRSKVQISLLQAIAHGGRLSCQVHKIVRSSRDVTHSMDTDTLRVLLP